ncbi:Hypothetical protein R9X50_00144300 [Acrodontium crateriforme]|uniref:BTB domain-containing protein n=1 Tax=Acrodontium crateriforme TaxID=150365 RepID=A0AAQ3R7W6_9PEZI|nr:Hypothetical protein R9X50_00144300 [Acrodontium crateriforme]
MERESITSKNAKSFAKLLTGPMVEISVGPEQKRWSLHRDLLCHHSSFFEVEFCGHEVMRRDDQDLRLDLPDEDPADFELLVKSLYHGELDGIDSNLTEEEIYELAVKNLKLYLLCEKFYLNVLKNQAMDTYRQGLYQAGLVPDAQETDEIYRQVPRDSPCRRLMTDIAARQIMDPAVTNGADKYRQCFENNPDFAVDLVNAIRRMSGGILFDDPTAESGCLYHDHTDGSTCRSAKSVPLSNGKTYAT